MTADPYAAAAQAIHAAKLRLWEGVIDPDGLARVALDAARPLIVAAERQRIRDSLTSRSTMEDVYRLLDGAS